MIKKLLAGFVLLCCVQGFSCSRFSLSDRAEGPVGGVFRVYVQIDTLDVSEEMTDSELDSHLLKKAVIRYKLLWNELLILKKAENDSELRSMIESSAGRHRIRIRREYDEYADAYVDFVLDKKFNERYLLLFPPEKKDEDGEDE